MQKNGTQMPFFFVFKRVVFCCFATVLQQATFLTAIFLRKTCRLQLCQGRFVVVGEQTCNLTVSVLSFSGRRVLSCWCRLCAVYSQRHCRLAGGATACFRQKFAGTASFIRFHVFSGRRCTFFLCAGGLPSVLEQALRCFSQHHCRLGRLGNCMFPSKVCRHSVFFSFEVFSDEKMCCNRFLLMRFCTTLFALFHVRKQFNVAFCKR